MLITLLSGLTCSAGDSLNLLKRVHDKYVGHKSISYHVSFRMKTFANDDTIKITGNCSLIREQKDSIFHGQIWMGTDDSLERLYNTRKLYIIDNKAKVITTEPLEKEGNCLDDVIRQALNPDP